MVQKKDRIALMNRQHGMHPTHQSSPGSSREFELQPHMVQHANAAKVRTRVLGELHALVRALS
jgi:hypothetical protein